MSEVVCVDSNICLKLVLPETDTPKALALWMSWQRSGTDIISSELWCYEVTSVIRNKGKRSVLDPEEEAKAIATLFQMPIQFLQPQGLHQRAWEIARYFNLSAAYDAHYLALAEIQGCPFWTVDERLYNSVSSELNWVYWLGNFRPPQ